MWRNRTQGQQVPFIKMCAKGSSKAKEDRIGEHDVPDVKFTAPEFGSTESLLHNDIRIKLDTICRGLVAYMQFEQLKTDLLYHDERLVVGHDDRSGGTETWICTPDARRPRQRLGGSRRVRR
jgi:hypothetical protein